MTIEVEHMSATEAAFTLLSVHFESAMLHMQIEAWKIPYRLRIRSAPLPRSFGTIFNALRLPSYIYRLATNRTQDVLLPLPTSLYSESKLDGTSMAA